jgi:hypothetical protein
MKISCAGFIPGHWYYSIGYPWGGPIQVAIPVYATYAKAPDGKRVLIGEDAVIPGMSGGPVLDETGSRCRDNQRLHAGDGDQLQQRPSRYVSLRGRHCMSWLAVLGLLKRFGSFLGSLNVWQLLCIGLALFAGLQTIRVSVEKRHSAKVETQLAKCSQARHADQQAYRKAQADAQAKNAARRQRTEQRQKEISDARVADLNARLERIARELRDNPAAKGSAGRTPIPETGPAPCRAFDSAWLCLSPADRLLAAENEERHDQLIDWVIQQSKIDPNK